MGEIADDHSGQIDDELARGYRPRFWGRPSKPLPSPARWFRIEVTKDFSGPDTQFSCAFEAQVWATSPSEAMKKLRPEFMHFHFRVINA